MSVIFDYLNKLPWTKPIAIITWAGVALMIAAAFVQGRDIPSNAKEVCIYFGGTVIAAATGKSAYEGVRRRELSDGGTGDERG